MGTPLTSILLFALAALLGAIGQYLYESGAQSADGGIAGYAFNARLWLGVACYVAVMVLFVAAFRIGGRLTVLYPIYASTFAWALLIAWWTQGQALRPVHGLGVLALVLGMYLLGR